LSSSDTEHYDAAHTDTFSPWHKESMTVVTQRLFKLEIDLCTRMLHVVAIHISSPCQWGLLA